VTEIINIVDRNSLVNQIVIVFDSIALYKSFTYLHRLHRYLLTRAMYKASSVVCVQILYTNKVNGVEK